MNIEDTYLKDSIKKCVDYVMSKNDEDKRRIITGMFQYNDYLINEQLVVKALNDEEKQEWFNNEIFETKDKEIERLNTNLEVANEDLTRIAQLLDLEEGCTIYDIEDKIERLNNIIKELEKYLEEIKDRVIMYGIDDDTYKTTNLYRDIKNKIKELKGSDKE